MEFFDASLNPSTIDIAKASLTLTSYEIPYAPYGAKSQLTATFNGQTLAEGTDYTLDYSNNVQTGTNTGTATATITGTGNYQSTRTANFSVLPDETTLLRPYGASRGHPFTYEVNDGAARVWLTADMNGSFSLDASDAFAVRYACASDGGGLAKLASSNGKPKCQCNGPAS